MENYACKTCLYALLNYLQKKRLIIFSFSLNLEVTDMWKWTWGFKIIWWTLGGYNKCY